MAQLAGTPVIILKEGTERTRGKDAFGNNVAASRAIAEAVRTTLGPKGMDKMLVDSLGDVTVTNDGATILDEIDVEHPAAKMMVEVAKTQDDKVGDGTTSAVIIGGELLKAAEELISQSVHPTVVVRGFRKAVNKAKEILDNIAEKVDPNDRDVMKKAAITAMNSKNIAGAQDYFADIAIDAVDQIKDDVGGEVRINLDYIQTIKKEGKSLKDTEFIRGVIVDKEVVHPLMPKMVKDAKIAVVDAALEVEKTEFDAEIRITNPDQMQAFLDEEEKMLRNLVEKLKSAGASVVFCQKGIDDMAQHFLAKNGIMAIRRVKRSDIEKLSRATGAKIVNNVDTITGEDLGYAGLVEEKKVAKDKMIFVEECKDPKSVSILIRGGTEHVVDEVDRTLNDALCVVKSLHEDPYIVGGGGAAEVELSRGLQEYASTVEGREQLAISAYASALEIIPKTLAENGGFDPVDVLVELRAAHENPNGKFQGINLAEGKAADMLELGVVEPKVIISQAIQSATEVASMILRIDDVIAASHPASSDMPDMPEGDSDFD
ncbi:MAG: thermosome subunit beta [Promethearchaeota archaeon]